MESEKRIEKAEGEVLKWAKWILRFLSDVLGV
jgi:hypothetical protein